MKHSDTLSFTEALETALSRCITASQTEVVMTESMRNRILAEDIVVRKNLPSFNNSAMDGFAFRYEERGSRLAVKASVFAGDTPKPILKPGECYKIMTGAQVPSDADTIVPIEMCPFVSDTHVEIPDDIKKGNAFRIKGEEQKAGNLLFEKGTRLSSAHIALLSAQGIVAVKVYRPLRIAVLSTGNEIREPWEHANEDEIYNANASALVTLLGEYGFNAVYTGAIPDDPQATVAFITGLREHYDVLITTGGISMGDHDFTQNAFVKNGLEVLFHGIRVKPGHPTMMGLMDSTFVMAMPGNPLAAMLNTLLLSIPLLFKMQGCRLMHHSFVYAKNVQPFGMRPGRTNIVLGKMENGTFHVTRNNKYGSGMLTPIAESNTVALFDETVAQVEADETIKVIQFEQMPQADKAAWMNG